MIQSRSDLKKYLREDYKRNFNSSKLSLLKIIQYKICKPDSYIVYKYLKALRLYEFYKNMYDASTSLFKYYWVIPYLISYFRWSRKSRKYGIMIGPNMVGYGLRIVHINGGIIINCNKMGNYCGINSGVVIGNKKGKEDRPIIGDHVIFTPHACCFGCISIGNNVVVAPNSVVIKDVPDNCIVSGVPAHIIKQNGIKV